MTVWETGQVSLASDKGMVGLGVGYWGYPETVNLRGSLTRASG